MLTRPQQILVKRAQREAGLNDADYRDALQAVSGCRSSKDAALTDRHVDQVLAYLEAIYWRAVEKGEMQPHCKPDAIFRQKGYWAQKNTHQETSRDRYIAGSLSHEIKSLEAQLGEFGFGPAYFTAIRHKVTQGHTDPRSQHAYRNALRRTLSAKQRKFSDAESAQAGKV